MSLVESNNGVRERGKSNGEVHKFRVSRARIARRYCERKRITIRICQCCGHESHIEWKTHIERSEGNLFSYSLSNHDVFKYFIPLLLVLLQVKVQATNKSVFETHPAYTWAFLLAAFIYYLALTAYKKSKLHHSNYSLFFSIVAVISGSLSSVLLLSIFLSSLVGNLIFLILWAFESAIVAWKHASKKQAYQQLQKILKAIYQKYVSGIHESSSGRRGSMDQPQLPL